MFSIRTQTVKYCNFKGHAGNINQHLCLLMKSFQRNISSSCYVFFILIFLSLASSSVSAESITAKEYYLKAAYLYNFARLVEWPEQAFSHPETPIRLCLIGQNPFGQALSTIQDKKVKNRTLKITTEVDILSLSTCQILFVGEQKTLAMDDILKLANKHPILTVSELENFAHKKGHIRLFLADRETLSLEINLGVLEQSGLRISSRVLTLAKIIRTEGAEEK